MSTILVEALILFSLLVSSYPSEIVLPAEEPSVPERNIPEPDSNGIKLTIRTDKNKYRSDEPIRIDVQLENVGKEAIYINSFLEVNMSLPQGAYLSLNIYDSKANPLLGSGAGSSAARSYPTDVLEIVKSRYFLLTPGHFYGVTKITLSSLQMRNGGIYRLVANYTDTNPTKWTAYDRTKLKNTVFGGALRSETWIEIVH